MILRLALCYLHLVILLPLRLAENMRKPCFPITSTFSRDLLRGEWEVIKPKALASVCDNGGERSCAAKNKAKFAKSKHYKVSSCHLPEFSAHSFEKALGDRDIFFVGDSVMMQQKTRLQCEVNNITKIHGIRISHSKHFLDRLSRLGRIPYNSIVLMNIGLHYNDLDLYRQFLLEFERKCLKSNCTNGTLIWQESAAQHFPSSNNGYFQVRGRCSKGCVKLNRSKIISGDFRNRIANEVMLKYGIPVLPVFEITHDAQDLHTQFNSKTGLCDCTHFCNTPYGVFRVYNRVLQAFLATYKGIL